MWFRRFDDTSLLAAQDRLLSRVRSLEDRSERIHGAIADLTSQVDRLEHAVSALAKAAAAVQEAQDATRAPEAEPPGDVPQIPRRGKRRKKK